MRKNSFFVAATGQNVGKTTICLGLMSGLIKRQKNVGYLKPVGQEHVEIPHGIRVDKDVLLFRSYFQLPDEEKEMSPVLFPKGFTRDYLDGKIKREELIKAIDLSFDTLLQRHSMLVVEGTGHTGVGSIVDLNNAQVAAHLKIPIVLVASGGLGSSFDELELNRIQCEKYNVPVLGVILNRVLDEKREMIVHYMEKALARWNLPLLGAIPYDSFLSTPTMADFEMLFQTSLYSGAKHRFRHFEHIRLVISLPEIPHHPKQLLILPASREDLILSTLTRFWDLQISHPEEDLELGLILTGKTPPKQTLLDQIAKTNIPTLYTPLSSFIALKMINTYTSKIGQEDTAKIEEAVKVVESHIDFEKLVGRLETLC
ncbi:MAG TPA: AAA family ATPase [Chlamydiales bacterium]